jgi:DNA-directed RNA polymerase subunit RPC12/RpoP
MAIRFACPSCHKALKAPDDKAGVRVTCPGCKHPLVIPSPDEPILEVLPVEEEAGSGKGPPPLPAGPVATPAQKPQHAGADGDGKGNGSPPTSQTTSTGRPSNAAPATSTPPGSTLRPVVGLFAKLKEGLQSQQKRVEGLAKGVQQTLQVLAKGVQQSIEERVRAVAGLGQGSTPTVQPSPPPNREDGQPSGPLPPPPTTPVEGDSTSARGGQTSLGDRLRQAKEQAAREKLANLKRTLNRQVEGFQLKEAYRTARHILNLAPHDDEAIAVKAQIEKEYPESVPDDRMLFRQWEASGTKYVSVLCECQHQPTFAWGQIGQEVECPDCAKRFVLQHPTVMSGTGQPVPLTPSAPPVSEPELPANVPPTQDEAAEKKLSLEERVRLAQGRAAREKQEQAEQFLASLHQKMNNAIEKLDFKSAYGCAVALAAMKPDDREATEAMTYIAQNHANSLAWLLTDPYRCRHCNMAFFFGSNTQEGFHAACPYCKQKEMNNNFWPVLHHCVHCGVLLETPDELKGRVTTCPACRRQIAVPIKLHAFDASDELNQGLVRDGTCVWLKCPSCTTPIMAGTDDLGKPCVCYLCHRICTPHKKRGWFG